MCFTITFISSAGLIFRDESVKVGNQLCNNVSWLVVCHDCLKGKIWFANLWGGGMRDVVDVMVRL